MITLMIKENVKVLTRKHSNVGPQKERNIETVLYTRGSEPHTVWLRNHEQERCFVDTLDI